MIGVHPFLLYDYARERQRDLLAEAEQASLAKAAHSDSSTAWPRPTFLLSLVLVCVLGAATWTLLS